MTLEVAHVTSSFSLILLENNERTADHVSSCVTGHQVADGGGRRSQYAQSRTSKLTVQLKAKGTESKVLNGVCIYINGFLVNQFFKMC